MPTLEITEILARLVELQRTDSGLDELLKARQKFLDEVSLGAAKVDALKARVLEEKKVQEEAAKRRKTYEIEAGTHETRISKYQNQLAEVKSNKEYDALKLEIEKGKEEKGKLEEKILECFFQEDEQKGKIQALSAELQQEEKKAAGERQVLEGKIQDCEKAAGEKKAERGRQVAEVPEDYAEKYEGLRAQGKKVAVAPVLEDQTCGGCHMNVPAQTLIEARKNQALQHCTCGRYLYVKD